MRIIAGAVVTAPKLLNQLHKILIFGKSFYFINTTPINPHMEIINNLINALVSSNTFPELFNKSKKLIAQYIEKAIMQTPTENNILLQNSLIIDEDVTSSSFTSFLSIFPSLVFNI